MIVALCLYKYFPYGGLQRDFMRIAKTIAARGHHVRVYTRAWQGERPAEFECVDVPVTAHSNHGRDKQYQTWVQQHLTQYPADRVLGFNKMPGLDVYYAADVCYAEKVAREKGFFYKLTRRYRHYSAFEKATFQQGSSTTLLMLTDKQIGDFKLHYHTESQRFRILPPGIYPDRKYSLQPENSRKIVREKNGIGLDQFLLLQVGSDFKRKGVPRSLQALASLPETIRHRTQLMVVGQDKADRYRAQARQLGIEEQVQFFSGRDDVAELMSAADLLLHPAVQEAAGIVLLEAVVAGLPVLTTEVCGYAGYISAAQCGVVIPEPFAQDNLNTALFNALQNNEQRSRWARNARHFADTEDLYSLADKAADIILGLEND